MSDIVAIKYRKTPDKDIGTAIVVKNNVPNKLFLQFWMDDRKTEIGIIKSIADNIVTRSSASGDVSDIIHICEVFDVEAVITVIRTCFGYKGFSVVML